MKNLYKRYATQGVVIENKIFCDKRGQMNGIELTIICGNRRRMHFFYECYNEEYFDPQIEWDPATKVRIVYEKTKSSVNRAIAIKTVN